MTHPHTKPFNLEHAKAGAPIGLADADECKFEILKYTDKKIIGTITNHLGDEAPEQWQLNGGYGIAPIPNSVLRLVMLPLGYCEDKPVFIGDELINIAGKLEVIDVNDNGINFNNLGMKWPKPEPKYPKSRMGWDDLCESYFRHATNSGEALGRWSSESAKNLADRAIARAIQDGDVFTKQQVTAVLEELRNICDRNQGAGSYSIRSTVDNTDWDTILKAGL